MFCGSKRSIYIIGLKKEVLDMGKEYSLAELLKNPQKRLTKYQWNNFGKLYMRMENDDKSADEVDIGAAIKKRIEEIRKKGTYRR
jgi:hypothetical protein